MTPSEQPTEENPSNESIPTEELDEATLEAITGGGTDAGANNNPLYKA